MLPASCLGLTAATESQAHVPRGLNRRTARSCSDLTLSAFTSRTSGLGLDHSLGSFSCAQWSAKPLPPSYEVILGRLMRALLLTLLSLTTKLSDLPLPRCPDLTTRRRPVGG